MPGTPGQAIVYSAATDEDLGVGEPVCGARGGVLRCTKPQDHRHLAADTRLRTPQDAANRHYDGKRFAWWDVA